MLLTTTNTIEGKTIIQYYGIVSGETIIGANVFKDLFASIRDIVGGRSGSYESTLRKAKETALREMTEQAERLGANAVIGVDLDYETVGGNGSMLMVPRLAPPCAINSVGKGNRLKYRKKHARRRRSFIQAHWQAVLFRGGFLLSKDGKRTISASSLSTALIAARIRPTSVINAIRTMIGRLP